MKLFPIYAFILAILAVRWTTNVTFNMLQTHCEESTVDKILGLLRHWVGLPDPHPPWWKPICWLADPNQRELTKSTILTGSGTFLLMVYVIVKGKKKKRKRISRSLKPRFRRKSSSKRNTMQIESRGKVSLPSLAILSPNLKYNTNNNTTVDMYKSRLDDEIHIKHELPKDKATYQKILLGPVGKTFDGVRVLLNTMFKALGIPESAMSWSSRVDPTGCPVFLGVTSQTTKAEAVLVPGEGIDLLVQKMGPPRGLIRELTYRSYQLTYRGIVCTDEGTSLLYGSSWDQ